MFVSWERKSGGCVGKRGVTPAVEKQKEEKEAVEVWDYIWTREKPLRTKVRKTRIQREMKVSTLQGASGVKIRDFKVALLPPDRSTALREPGPLPCVHLAGRRASPGAW